MAATKEKKKNALINYFEESYQEIRKVAWPTKNRAIRLTFLVLGFVLVVAIFLGILDNIFGFGHNALLDIAPKKAIPTIEDTAVVDTPAVTVGDEVVTEITPEDLEALVEVAPGDSDAAVMEEVVPVEADAVAIEETPPTE